MKSGRECHGFGEEYNVEKREWREIFGQKIKTLKNVGWEEFQVVRNCIHPCKRRCGNYNFRILRNLLIRRSETKSLTLRLTLALTLRLTLTLALTLTLYMCIAGVEGV